MGETSITDENAQDAAPAKAPTLSMEQLDALGKDKPPRKKAGRPKGSKNKEPSKASAAETAKQTKEIEELLAEILQTPALPHGFRLMKEEGDWTDEYLVKHYEAQGPRLAKQLAKNSEKVPFIRNLLVAGKEGAAVGGLVIAIGAYLYGPAMVLGYAPPIPVAGTMLSVDLPVPPAGPEGEPGGEQTA